MLFGLIIASLLTVQSGTYKVGGYTDGCCLITEDGNEWATDVFRPDKNVVITFHDNGTPYYKYDDIVINVE